MQILRDTLEMLSIPPRDMFNIVFSLVLAVALAIVVSQIYKYTHRGLSYELSFMTTLVSLAPIVAVVMLFIRGDLVLSLGLIGSLSIVRFRTPIKDTRDMVFIFWIIAIGLGSGTYNWIIVIVSTIIMTILMFLLHFIKYGQTYSIDYVLVVSGTGKHKSVKIDSILQKYVKDVTVRSKESEEDHWETIFEVQFKKDSLNKTDLIIDELRELDGVNRASLLAPQVSLPV